MYFYLVLNTLARRDNSIHIKTLVWADLFPALCIERWSIDSFLDSLNECASPLQLRFLVSVHETASITSIDRGFVQDQCIFYIISGVRHDCNSSVLTSWQLLEANQLDRTRFYQRALWVDQIVQA